MTVYKVYENIEMKFPSSGYPGVNTWLATFRDPDEAFDYYTKKKENDYETMDIKKEHYILEENV